MVRKAIVYVVPALAIVVAWMRIEDPHAGLLRAGLLAAIALVPALVGERLRAVALAAALLLGSWLALGASIATPGRVLARLWNGSLEFYDATLPFSPAEHPRMHGAVLFAVLGFCLALGLALAARRPLVAGLVVAVGAGWPGTLLRGGSDLLLGGLILAAILVVMAGLRPLADRASGKAVVAGGAVVAVALALASSPAIARGEFLHWEAWDLYDRPDKAVSVTYVWNSNYDGLDWPKKATTVLTAKAPERPMYWRATTLDAFLGDNWVEDLVPTLPAMREGDRAELTDDRLLPAVAKRRILWVKQDITIKALHDRHLIGADEPVAYATGDIETVSYARGGVALVVPGLNRDKTYTVWSSIRRPTPRQLARSQPDYPLGITVDRGVYVPPFGAPKRDRAVAEVISARTPAYSRLYREAKRVVGRARNPYAAVVALESWLRDSGEFRYDEQPPSVPGVPPLVSFVTDSRRGYCQHFAGAMALMLRYLGIPARVAAGFGSGKYDGGSGTWTVTDRDGHTWVEVWFRGYGWLPFDPTPGRAALSAPYSASSDEFDAGAAAALVGAGSVIQELLESEANAGPSGARGEHARSVPVAASGGSRGLIVAGMVVLALLSLAFVLFATKAARRRARYLTADPRRVAAACRRELVEILLDQRVEVPPSATLRELGVALHEEFGMDASRLVDAAGAARFGAPRRAGDAAERARSELRLLRRALRRRLGILDCVVGALSIRSLRSA